MWMNSERIQRCKATSENRLRESVYAKEKQADCSENLLGKAVQFLAGKTGVWQRAFQRGVRILIAVVIKMGA